LAKLGFKNGIDWISMHWRSNLRGDHHIARISAAHEDPEESQSNPSRRGSTFEKVRDSPRNSGNHQFSTKRERYVNWLAAIM